MKRIVLGTAPLGSAVSQTEGIEIIRAAYAAGVRCFDTAPQYGAGYAPQLLRIALGSMPDAKVSTKIGGPRENGARYALKRVLRARSLKDCVGLWPPNVGGRNSDSWWSARSQLSKVERAGRALGDLAREYLFLHSPPMAIDQAAARELALLAGQYGFMLGICGPHHAQLSSCERLSPFAATQLHLDMILTLSQERVDMLLRRPLWIHGIYSAGASAKIRDIRARERFCIEAASQHPEVRLVVSSKSVNGVARIRALSAEIVDKTGKGEEHD